MENLGLQELVVLVNLHEESWAPMGRFLDSLLCLVMAHSVSNFCGCARVFVWMVIDNYRVKLIHNLRKWV
jgi:hypothetical protein